MSALGYARFEGPTLSRLSRLGIVILAHAALGVWLSETTSVAFRAVEQIRVDVSLIAHVEPTVATAVVVEPSVLAEPLVELPAEIDPLHALVEAPAPVLVQKPKPEPVPMEPRTRATQLRPEAMPQSPATVSQQSVPAAASQLGVGPPSYPQPVASAPEFVEARFNADYLRNPPPAYPPVSRRRKEEGRVLLTVRVSAEGAAVQVQIRESSGYNRLDEAALSAVQGWRFIPARRGDQPVAATVVVPIIFRLDA